MVEIRAAAPAATATAVDLPDDPVAVRAAAGRLARELPAGPGEFDAGALNGPRLAAFAEGLALGCYRFTRATGADDGVPTTIDLCGAADPDAVESGLRTAAAVVWARDLANTRSGEKTPKWLGKQAARALAPLGIDVAVRGVDWLERRGFGGVLAVGRGSAAPPRLIEARWRPRAAPAGVHIVLVGKGITFDTGGLDRKTGTSMNTMHTDMAGGAAVLAALRLVAERNVPLRVTALVPAAENSLSGSAYRPSDVVRHVGGRTSEIHNTDAEGRLVLADALAHAVRSLRPTALVDIATLTGATKVALGTRTGGLFATDDELADGLLAAGSATGEPLWRLPMPVEYESTLESSVADATNAPGAPGGITAAMFLRPFAGDVPWAHLDVAGPARADRDDAALSRGATGFGARLLAAWVESQVESQLEPQVESQLESQLESQA